MSNRTKLLFTHYLTMAKLGMTMFSVCYAELLILSENYSEIVVAFQKLLLTLQIEGNSFW